MPVFRWIRSFMVISSAVVLLLIAGEAAVRIAGAFSSVGGREDPDAFHLYIVGASTAQGVPYQPLSFGDMVFAMFEGTLEGRRIQVHNLARSGDTVYTQWVRFIQAVRARDTDIPGAVLIYAGHNDGSGGLDLVEIDASTRLERVICDHSALGLATIYGVRRLLHRSAANGQDSYEYYLTAVMETAREAGLTPFVSTVISNVSDLEPNYITEDREGVRRAIEAAGPQVAAGACEEAQRILTEALPEGRGRDAFGAYRTARCLEDRGRYPQALEAFWRAVELDPRTPFGRATPGQNALVTRLAREQEVPLVDAVAAFQRATPHGLVGGALFSDGQHPNLRGHLLLAVAFAEAIALQLDAPILRRFEGPEEVRAAFPSDDPRFPALHGGSWLLASSLQHPWPEDRLRLAEARFREALEIDPDSFTGWMGLGLVLAGRTSSLLQRPEVIEQIDHWGGNTYHGFSVPGEELDSLLELLRSVDVDPTVLAGIERTHPDRQQGSRAGPAAGGQ